MGLDFKTLRPNTTEAPSQGLNFGCADVRLFERLPHENARLHTSTVPENQLLASSTCDPLGDVGTESPTSPDRDGAVATPLQQAPLITRPSDLRTIFHDIAPADLRRLGPLPYEVV